MKKIFYKIRLILAIPALTIHELSHLIVIIISSIRFRKLIKLNIKHVLPYDIKIINIDKEKSNYMVEIIRDIPKYKFTEYLISLSPILAIILLAILGIIFPYFGIVFYPYAIIFMRTFLPSSNDIQAIRNWKTEDELFFESLK